MDTALIRLESLSKYYTSGQNVVVGLYNLDLQFSRGEFVAITGESGSGKSTLSHVLGGILPYESGEFYLNGQPTSHYDSEDWERYRRDNISFISQNYGILPGATVLSNVVTALRLSGMEKHASKDAAEEILRQVDLWELRHRRAAKLSSGQKQRLSIARALAKPAPILIADEPTGNLDPENSQKIIELLAKAAQSRLVLLVTHEFSEAEDFATRHITLQDGRIVMDAPLRPANTPDDLLTVQTASPAPMSPYVAWLQQRSRPIWTTLMTLFFSLTAFAVFAFLGAFIIALDDTNTRIYDPSAFFNGSMTRIVVTTLEQRSLTQEDFDRILDVPYVTALEKNGYVSDTQYSYREDVDYKVVHTEQVDEWRGTHWIEVSYHPSAKSPFIQTVPLLAEGTFPVLEGHLPENFFEVVAHSSDGLSIGDTVMVFITNDQYWGSYQHARMEFTVVGITDYGSGLYFDESVGRFCQQIAHSDNGSDFPIFVPENLAATKKQFQFFLSVNSIDPAVTLPDGASIYLADDEFRCHPNLYAQLMTRNEEDEPIVVYECANINLDKPFEKENLLYFSSPSEIVLSASIPAYSYYLHNLNHTRLIEVSQSTFDALTWNTPSEQVSITIEDYAYTQRVLDALQEQGYIAVSPYQQGSARIDEEKYQERKQTLSVCLAALAAVAALQIVLLRAMFSVQTESYKLLSNIGLVSKTAKRSALWQILSFTVLGELIGSAAIWLCGRSGIQRIEEILRYLPAKYIAILSAVHLLVSLVAAIWVVTALGKQVYPLAGKFSDINLDTAEKETAV